MKKPLIIMISIIGTVAILCAMGVATYMYVKNSGAPSGPHVLTPSQQAALQITYPQMTTNLQSSGLVQFTLTLQASDSSTKSELTDLTPEVQDLVNRDMLQFTSSQLGQTSGFDALKHVILTDVNHILQHGQVTKVYFSQIVVQ